MKIRRFKIVFVRKEKRLSLKFTLLSLAETGVVDQPVAICHVCIY